MICLLSDSIKGNHNSPFLILHSQLKTMPIPAFPNVGSLIACCQLTVIEASGNCHSARRCGAHYGQTACFGGLAAVGAIRTDVVAGL